MTAYRYRCARRLPPPDCGLSTDDGRSLKWILTIYELNYHGFPVTSHIDLMMSMGVETFSRDRLAYIAVADTWEIARDCGIEFAAYGTRSCRWCGHPAFRHRNDGPGRRPGCHGSDMPGRGCLCPHSYDQAAGKSVAAGDAP